MVKRLLLGTETVPDDLFLVCLAVVPADAIGCLWHLSVVISGKRNAMRLLFSG